MRSILLLGFSFLVLKQQVVASPTEVIDSLRTKNRLGLLLGTEQNLYLDELTSPLIYTGFGAQFRLTYQRQMTNACFEATADIARVNVIPKYHQDRTLFITPLVYIPEVAIDGDTVLKAKIGAIGLPHLGLQAAFYHKLAPTKSKRFNTSIGGIFTSNVRIPAANNVIVYTPICLSSIDLGFKGTYAVSSRLSLSLRAEMPMAILAIRLPYSLSPVEPEKGVYRSAFSNGKLVSWGKYQAARGLFNIHFLLNTKFSLDLNLSSSYFHYSYPKPIRFLQYNTSLGVSMSF